MQLTPEEAESESGVLYLVKNKHGPGKHIVRRPPPPPSTAPLDDDFDRATTLPPATPRIPRNSRDYRPSNDVAGSISPLDDDFDAVTYTVAAGRESAVAVRDRTPIRKNEARKVVPGMGKEGFEAYGEYGYYMNQQERRYRAGTPPADVMLSPGRRPRELEGAGERGAQMNISKPTTLGPLGKTADADLVASGATGVVDNTGTSRGGPSFEIINRRVLESGPERTVLISTWREQVADATDQRDSMDVYYLNAMDYAADESGGADATYTEPEEPVSRKPILPPPVRKSSGSETRSNQGSIRSIPDEGSRGERPSPERPQQRKVPGQAYYSDEIPATTSRSESTSAQSSWNRNRTPPRRATPEHRDARSPSSLRKPTNAYYVAAAETSPPPRSSTPVRRSPGRSPERVHTPLLLGRSPNRVYPPALPPPPSFHPTQSGSTISTIKSASTVAFENVLASCDPPLLHISSALANLGIVNEGHLRAIARLSEETRDKEVKEEALKQGITVMEWAILLDRLQRL